jgi:hypothetical protein
MLLPLHMLVPQSSGGCVRLCLVLVSLLTLSCSAAPTALGKLSLAALCAAVADEGTVCSACHSKHHIAPCLLQRP